MDMYSLTRQLREADRQRDHARALLADASLAEEVRKIDTDWWDNKAERKAVLEAKIAKRARRRAKELAELGSAIRPGPWDDDLDNYPESSYEEDAGDGYRIRINRVYDGTWNGYVIIPATHPYSGKHYDFFNEGPGIPRPPSHLTYGGSSGEVSYYERPMEPGLYGFYFSSTVKPYPDYGMTSYQANSFYSAEKAEYGAYITYANMRSYCVDLVKYFQKLETSTTGLESRRCKDCYSFYTTMSCDTCTKSKRSWAAIVAGRSS